MPFLGIASLDDLLQLFVKHDHDGSHLRGQKLRPTSIGGPGDMELQDGYGIILNSADGTKRQKVTLGNDGVLHYDDL